MDSHFLIILDREDSRTIRKALCAYAENMQDNGEPTDSLVKIAEKFIDALRSRQYVNYQAIHEEGFRIKLLENLNELKELTGLAQIYNLIESIKKDIEEGRLDGI